jgi:hypothetical protein
LGLVPAAAAAAAISAVTAPAAATTTTAAATIVTTSTAAPAAAISAAATTTTGPATPAEAAATATAPAVSPATTTESATGTLFARTGLIHGEGSALDRLAVELRDGILGFLVGAHRHEGEPPRFAGEFILDQLDGSHRAGLAEEILEVDFRRRERKVANV